MTVARAQVWKEDGRLFSSRVRRGPQYVHDEDALSVMELSDVGDSDSDSPPLESGS